MTLLEKARQLKESGMSITEIITELRCTIDSHGLFVSDRKIDEVLKKLTFPFPGNRQMEVRHAEHN